MSRGSAVIVVIVAALLLLLGALGLFSGIAAAFPTTEEAFVEVGVELSGIVLFIFAAVFVAASVYLVRLAGQLQR